MTDTSGRSLRVPLAHFAPEESCSKTWQVTSLWGWMSYSETWPRWGMTRRGELYELPMPALLMDELVSSSLPTPRATRGGSATETTYLLNGQTRKGDLLPTPLSADGGPRGSSAGWGLRNVSRQLLPTPEAKLSDSGPDYARAEREGSGGDDLTTTLHRLFPTPRATDGTKGGPNQRGSSGDLMLPSAVLLLPTPAAHDSGNSPEAHLRKKPGRSQVTSLQVIVDHGLLPSGGRIDPPSTDGSASQDAPHPDLLNPDPEAESA